MARLINWALADLMIQYPSIVLVGEDVGPKGGVYGISARLHERFGPGRVVDSLLDEQSILGLAIGLGHNGQLAIPEIQFLAYLHNAEDQVRGEAATLSFFSNGQYTNPMVIRIAGLGYQKGFGGHFHNDNSISVLRDIPGVVIACPSHPEDAVLLLRECVRLAREEQRVVVFLEPIALYMTRDLHAPEDGQWCAEYPPPDSGKCIALGEPGVHGNGRELAILTYGNGHYLSRRAAKTLKEHHAVRLRVVDLRWLAPLDERQIIKSIKACRHVLIVDECRRTGSQSEALRAMLTERATWQPKVARITGEDTFIPLGKAATVPLPSEEAIVRAALDLLGKSRK
jgi:2-oxoisovalerate dehydrogenase E1 component